MNFPKLPLVSYFPKAVQKKLGEYIGGNYYNQYDISRSYVTTKDDVELKKKRSSEVNVLEVLFVMDCTISMNDWIKISSKCFFKSIETVKAAHPEWYIRAGCVLYRDFCDGNMILQTHDFTLDMNAVKKFLGDAVPHGGGDIPEDLQGGFQEGLDLDWREDSLKMCFLCTDAPAHGSKYHDASVTDNTPDGNPAGYEIEQQIGEMLERDISLTVYDNSIYTKPMFDLFDTLMNKKRPDSFRRLDLTTALTEARKNAPSMDIYSPDSIISKEYELVTVRNILEKIDEYQSKKDKKVR